MMDFSKAYNRADFVNYLRRDFLPDDFEQEEKNRLNWPLPSSSAASAFLMRS